MVKTYLFKSQTRVWEEQQKVCNEELLSLEPSLIFSRNNNGMITQEEIDALLNGGDMEEARRKKYYMWLPLEKKYERVELTDQGIEACESGHRAADYCCIFDFKPLDDEKFLSDVEIEAPESSLSEKLVKKVKALFHKNEGNDVGEKKKSEAPFCWQVYCNQQGDIIIRAWLMVIYNVQVQDAKGKVIKEVGLRLQKELLTLSIFPQKCTWFFQQVKAMTKEKTVENFPAYYNGPVCFSKEMPDCVMKAAKNLLVGKLKIIYGNNYQYDNYQVNSIQELLNLADKPLKPEIGELRYWFFTDDYARVFPSGNFDYCASLCKEFDIELTPAVREAYEINYYYIFFYKCIRAVGFSVGASDEIIRQAIIDNSVERIYGRKIEDVTYSYFPETFNKYVRLPTESTYFQAVQFYYAQRFKVLGEKVVAKEFLAKEYNLFCYQGVLKYDSIILVHKDWGRLKEDLKQKIILEGLTEGVMERIFSEAEILL